MENCGILTGRACGLFRRPKLRTFCPALIVLDYAEQGILELSFNISYIEACPIPYYRPHESPPELKGFLNVQGDGYCLTDAIYPAKPTTIRHMRHPLYHTNPVIVIYVPNSKQEFPLVERWFISSDITSRTIELEWLVVTHEEKVRFEKEYGVSNGDIEEVEHFGKKHGMSVDGKPDAIKKNADGKCRHLTGIAKYLGQVLYKSTLDTTTVENWLGLHEDIYGKGDPKFIKIVHRHLPEGGKKATYWALYTDLDKYKPAKGKKKITK